MDKEKIYPCFGERVHLPCFSCTPVFSCSWFYVEPHGTYFLLHIHPLNLVGIVQNYTYIQKEVRTQPDRMIGECRCSGFQMHAQGVKPGVQCDFCYLIKLFLVILYNMTAVKFRVHFRQIVDTNSFVIFSHD